MTVAPSDTFSFYEVDMVYTNPLTLYLENEGGEVDSAIDAQATPTPSPTSLTPPAPQGVMAATCLVRCRV